MKKLLAVYLAVVLSLSLFGQRSTIGPEILQKVTNSAKSKIKAEISGEQRGIDLLNKADEKTKKAEELRNQMNSLKGGKKRKARKQAEALEEEANKYYVDGYSIAMKAMKRYYATMQDDIKNLYPLYSADAASKAKSKVQQAKKQYEQAMNEIKAGYKEKEAKNKVAHYSKAYELLHTTLRTMISAYDVLKGGEQKSGGVVLLIPTGSGDLKPVDKIVVKDKKTKPKPKTTPKKQPKSNSSFQPAQKTTSTTVVTTTKPKPRREPQYNPNVYFRVQVAASLTPLSTAKLRSIYQGRVIREYDAVDHYYKYVTVEKFNTYGQAKAFKAATGVPGAFVVGYRNGKRVRNIKELVK